MNKPLIAALIPSPNFGYPRKTAGRGGQTVKILVLHITDGGMPDSWFASPTSEVSAHFGVSKEGFIHQYVSDRDAAWANGLGWNGSGWLTPGDVPVHPTAKVVLDNPGINPNLYSISIEHQGKGGDLFTEAQYQATSSLIAFYCEKYNLPIDRDHIIGHYEINPVDRAGCPGQGCNFEKMIALARQKQIGGNAVPAQEWLGDFQHASALLKLQGMDPGTPAGGATTVQKWIQMQSGTKRDFIYLPETGKTYVEVYPDRESK